MSSADAIHLNFSREESDLPEIRTSIPGPRSLEMAGRLSRVESPDTTFLAGDFPVFWDSAKGSVVTDVDGNRYLDLNAGFGVAAVGHSHPRVVDAVQRQSERLIHGMGDVHPSELKLRLAEEIIRRAPSGADWKVIFGTSGAEAVEAAMKTAAVMSGKPGIVCFEDAYHGLTLGTLGVTSWTKFRRGFEAMVPRRVTHLSYPSAGKDDEGPMILAQLEQLVIQSKNSPGAIGAVLIEPVLGRGGVVLPTRGFLARLREVCTDLGLLLIFDEVYTGFGRTGEWFACLAEDVVPDLIAAGKALGGGLPISVCIGRAEIIDKWGKSKGEARHTSTFLGNPLACASALEVLSILEEENLLSAAREKGDYLRASLTRELGRLRGVEAVRGRGMMLGIEIINPETSQPDGPRAWSIVVEALRRGLILLVCGRHGNILSLTPPLTISTRQMDHAVGVLSDVIRSI